MTLGTRWWMAVAAAALVAAPATGLARGGADDALPQFPAAPEPTGLARAGAGDALPQFPAAPEPTDAA